MCSSGTCWNDVVTSHKFLLSNQHSLSEVRISTVTMADLCVQLPYEIFDTFKLCLLLLGFDQPLAFLSRVFKSQLARHRHTTFFGKLMRDRNT